MDSNNKERIRKFVNINTWVGVEVCKTLLQEDFIELSIPGMLSQIHPYLLIPSRSVRSIYQIGLVIPYYITYLLSYLILSVPLILI